MNRFGILTMTLGVTILAPPVAYGQQTQKQIIRDANGNRVGYIEQEAPWSDKSVIYDKNGNRVGTIEPQAPWSDKSVVRDNNGVTQQTIQPDQGSVGAPADPFATPAEDDSRD